jgi:ABC-type sulfate transport system permease component
MTTNEIIAWLQIFQLVATLFLVPAIYVFRKAYKAFSAITKSIENVAASIIALREELHRDFVKKTEPVKIRRIK